MTDSAGNGTKGCSGDGIPATQASLAYPKGPGAARVGGPRRVSITPAGDALIADTGNHRIRRVH